MAMRRLFVALAKGSVEEARRWFVLDAMTTEILDNIL
jgi:hypothetical protein